MNRQRLISVDLLRFLAIFLMFWDHALKIFYDFNRDSKLANFFADLSINILLVTALSSALFLYLVGFSLVLSFNHRQKTKSQWFYRKLKRAAWLIPASYFLYYFRFVDLKTPLPLTSGILQLIGTSLILGSLILLLPRLMQTPLMVFLAITGFSVDHALRITNRQIQIINVLGFPLLPYFIYVLAGMLIAKGYFWIQKKEKGQLYLQIAAWSSLAGVAFFLSLFNFHFTGIFKLYHLIRGNRIHSGMMAVFGIALMTFLLTTMIIFEDKLHRIKWLKVPAGLGREALMIYFLHSLLGWGIGRYLLHYHKFSFLTSALIVLGFCLLGWAWVKTKPLLIKKTKKPTE